MVSRRARRSRGMTLIEVMMAMIVTLVALMGALATVGMLIRGSAFSRSVTEASALAQSLLEALVSLPTVPASSPAAGTTTETQLDGNGMVNSASGLYTRATTWSTSSDGLCRVITVDVSWIDGLNVPHHVWAARQKAPQ